MGVYINEMEMPKDGVYWCEIGIAGEIATITIHGEDRKSFPLVSVPPHGRLIDADAFKEYIHVSFGQVAPELEGGYKWLAERITKDLLNDIDDAPTIIRAEEDE